MKTYTHIIHTFKPVFDENSRVLILGTLPSVKSRECDFYYGHPQNRFWSVLSAITSTKQPESITEKKSMLYANGIALWDVIAECDIIGSSDLSIKNVIPTDLSVLFEKCRIKAVFANGKTAEKLYNKYQREKYGREIIALPSTSPANAAWSLDRLTLEWKSKILQYIT